MVRLRSFAVSAALLLASCGGAQGVASLSDATPDDVGSETEAEADTEQALLDFAACMREHGVDMEDPILDGDGNLRLHRPRQNGDGEVDREAAVAAREACREHLDGVTIGLLGQDRSVIEDTLLAYAGCMRDHGVDMPDPDFSGPGPGGGSPGGGGPFGAIDPEDPAFAAADEVCRDVFSEAGLDDRPGPGPGRGEPPPGDGG